MWYHLKYQIIITYIQRRYPFACLIWNSCLMKAIGSINLHKRLEMMPSYIFISLDAVNSCREMLVSCFWTNAAAVWETHGKILTNAFLHIPESWPHKYISHYIVVHRNNLLFYFLNVHSVWVMEIYLCWLRNFLLISCRRIFDMITKWYKLSNRLV